MLPECCTGWKVKELQLKIGSCALREGLTSALACLGAQGQKTYQNSPARMTDICQKVHLEACQSLFFPRTKPKLCWSNAIHTNEGQWQRQVTANTHKRHKSGETIGGVCSESMKRGGQTEWFCSLSGRRVPLLHKKSPVLHGWTETERGFFVLCNSNIVLELQRGLKRRSLSQAHNQPVLMMSASTEKPKTLPRLKPQRGLMMQQSGYIKYQMVLVSLRIWFSERFVKRQSSLALKTSFHREVSLSGCWQKLFDGNFGCGILNAFEVAC